MNMGENFKRIVDSKNVRVSVIARETKIPYSSLSEWYHGKYTPKIDKVIKVAEYLGVSVNDLLEDDKKIDIEIQSPAPEMAEDCVELLDYYIKLSDSDKALLIELAHNMVERTELIKKYMGTIYPTS